jgi:MftR C-terminal domain
MTTQELIFQVLGPRPDFQTRVMVAACLAAASTAILTWVENNGTPELPDLINQAFETLANGPTAGHQP